MPGFQDLSLYFVADGKDSSLSVLSLGGCSLDDKDLQAVSQALKQGLPLHMLKLSANRITGKAVDEFVQGLLAHASHPLALIDLSNNRVRNIKVNMEHKLPIAIL